MARNSLKNVVRLLDKQEIPVEQSFLQDLKRSIELTEESNRRPPSRTFKPSSMKCPREMYFQVIGAEQDEESANYCLIGICNSGSDIHERIQKAVDGMKANGMDCEYIDVAEFVKSRGLDEIEIVSKQGMETKLFHKQLNMSFLCDGIIKYKGKYYILELKTETVNKFWSRKSVADEHKNQATAYSLALGIEDVIFVYICRDNLDMKSFMLNVTNDERYNLAALIMRCQESVEQKEPPEKNENACRYCMYKTACKGVG